MERKRTMASGIRRAAVSFLGDRRSQQDMLDCRDLPGGAFAASVCDGMGGLNGGDLAAWEACRGFMELCGKTLLEGNWPDPETAAGILDRKVASLTDRDGLPLDGGTTLTGVCIQGNRAMWVAAGDSRIGLFREGRLGWLNRPHRYRLMLKEALQAGAVSMEEYQAEIIRGSALVSYLGRGELPYIDGEAGFRLLPGDRMILCSDGFWELLGRQGTEELLGKLDPELSNLAELATECMERPGRGRDNASAVVIGYELFQERERVR